MNITKKVIVCAAVCAIFGIGVTAYAVGNDARNISEPSGSSVEDTVEAEISDVPADDIKETETAKTVPGESTTSAVDPERIPHIMPSKFAPEDLDLINTGVPSLCSHTVFRAEVNSEVYAAADGEVLYADYDAVGWGSNFGYGSVVILKHADDLYTLYGFMNPVQLGGKAFVEAGDTVKAGQCIGLAGMSGKASDYGVAYACYSKCDEVYFPIVVKTEEGMKALLEKWGSGAVPKTDADENPLSKADMDNIQPAKRYDDSSIIVPEGYCGAIVDADGNIVELIPNSQALSDGIRPAN